MNFKVFTQLLAVAAFFELQASAKDENNPKYKFVLEKMEKPKNAESKIKTDLKFSKLDQEHFEISGEVDQLVELNDEWKVNVVVNRADTADGEFSAVFTMPTKGVCEMLKTYYKTYFYDTLKNYSNAPHYDKCPLIPEKYIINDYPFDAGKFEKFLRLGFYRIDVALLHSDVVEIEYHFFGHVEEKSVE